MFRSPMDSDHAPDPRPARNPLPRWRGFNLLDFFQALSSGERGQGHVSEDDLRWIRDWGFDYVRLPMDYWMWVGSDWRRTRRLVPDDVSKFDLAALEKVDRAVELCRKYGLHLTLSFHRAPGYCVNDAEREPFVLWHDARAADAFVQYWDVFARRYRAEPTSGLSFNLLNEPPAPAEGTMTRADYVHVMTRASDAIRRHGVDRIILVDGICGGESVVPELEPLGVAQSLHGYWPTPLSHYGASWVEGSEQFERPAWPPRGDGASSRSGRAELEQRYAPWVELARRGSGVHCGELGCYRRTPSEVALAWLADVMDVLRAGEIGWALWNLRGDFGVLDSGRSDVRYEEWHGHKLDRRMLTLLQRS